MFARRMTNNACEPGIITWDCDPSTQELKVILGYVNSEVEANLGYRKSCLKTQHKTKQTETTSDRLHYHHTFKVLSAKSDMA